MSLAGPELFVYASFHLACMAYIFYELFLQKNPMPGWRKAIWALAVSILAVPTVIAYFVIVKQSNPSR